MSDPDRREQVSLRDGHLYAVLADKEWFLCEYQQEDNILVVTYTQYECGRTWLPGEVDEVKFVTADPYQLAREDSDE